MHCYNYRWLYFFMMVVVIYGLNFIIFLQPQWELLHEALRLKNNIREKISIIQIRNSSGLTKQVKLLKPSTILTAERLLHRLSLEIHRANLTMKQLDEIIDESNDALEHLQLVVEGEFLSVINFMFRLWQSNLPVLIAEYDIDRAKNAYVKAVLNIAWMATPGPPLTVMPANAAPPKLAHLFCRSSEQLPVISRPANFYSIKLMKFIGFLEQENTITAWLLLPNRQVVSIRVGSFIGNEYAKILSISAKEVRFQLPEGAVFILSAV